MPRLFIVATPIGNLSDISARALQTLRDCDLIAAEDTRVTRALLNHFEIDTPCVSNHQHNEENRAAPIVARMLEEDLDVALVTDAGTPCISDPGSFLAKEAAAAGIEVLAMLRAKEKAEKGEYCLVLDLHDVRVAEKKTASDASLEARLFEQLMAGRDMREAGDALMEQGEKRNDVYRARTAVQKFLEELLEDDDE